MKITEFSLGLLRIIFVFMIFMHDVMFSTEKLLEKSGVFPYKALRHYYLLTCVSILKQFSDGAVVGSERTAQHAE